MGINNHVLCIRVRFRYRLHQNQENSFPRSMVLGVRIIAIILAIALGSFTATKVLAKEPVLIVSSDYAPYVSEKTGSGFLVDLVRQAFAEVNQPVTFQFYPWKRCEALVAEGKAFGSIPYVKTEERAKIFNFSEPLFLTSFRFLYNKDKFPQGFSWNRLEDFRGYTLGGGLGWYYMPDFEKAGLKVDTVPTEWQNLQKLVAQRIDFMVLDEVLSNQLLRQNMPQARHKIGFCEKPERVVPSHMLISRTYPEAARISAAFHQGLKKLKAKGQYQKLFKQHQMPKSMLVP